MLPRLEIKQVNEDATIYVVDTTDFPSRAVAHLSQELTKMGGQMFPAENLNEYCLLFSRAMLRPEVVAILNRVQENLIRKTQAKPQNRLQQTSLLLTESKRASHSIIQTHENKEFNDASNIEAAAKMRFEESHKLFNQLVSMGSVIDQCISIPANVEMVDRQIEIVLYLHVTANRKYYDPKTVRRVLLGDNQDAETLSFIRVITDFLSGLNKKFPVPTYTVKTFAINDLKVVRLSFFHNEIMATLSDEEQVQSALTVSSSSLLQSYLSEFNLRYPALGGKADLSIAYCLNTVFNLLNKQTFQATAKLLARQNANLSKAIIATEQFALTPLRLFESRENRVDNSHQPTSFITKLREVLQENQLDFLAMESFSIHPFIDFLLLKLGKNERMQESVWDVKSLFLTTNEDRTLLVVGIDNGFPNPATYFSFELNTNSLTTLLPEFNDYLAKHYEDYMKLRAVICQNANEKTMYVLSHLIIDANFEAANNSFMIIRNIIEGPLVTLPTVLMKMIYDYLFDTSDLSEIAKEFEPFEIRLKELNGSVNAGFVFTRSNMKLKIDSDAVLVTVDPSIQVDKAWTDGWTSYFKMQEEEVVAARDEKSPILIGKTSLMRINGLQYSADAHCLRMNMDYHRMFKPKPKNPAQQLEQYIQKDRKTIKHP